MVRPIAAAVLFWCLAGIPLYANLSHHPEIIGAASRVVIFAMAALSLAFLLAGGLLSLGHAAFLGIGAFVTAVCAHHGLNEFLIVLPLAMASGALFAAITGAVALRTRGINFALITFAFGQVVFSASGATQVLLIPQHNLVAGTHLFDDPVRFYWVCLLLLVISYLIVELLYKWNFGLVVRAIGMNSSKTELLGISRWSHLLKAYVISGTIASAAGVLLANQMQMATADISSWQQSAYLMVMAAAGGVGTILGSIGGAIAVVGLQEYLPSHFSYWQSALGLVIIGLALFHVFRTRGQGLRHE